MNICTETLHYKFWSLTFINSCSFLNLSEPAETTWLQYRLRIIAMAIPTMLTFILAWIFIFWETIILNTVMILSGSGVWVTWGAGAGSYLRKFRLWTVGITFRAKFINIDKAIRISTWVISASIWTVLIVSLSWYLWGHIETLQQLEDVMRNLIANAAPLLRGLLWFSEATLFVLVYAWLFDKQERANQKYVRRVLDEARKTKTSVPFEIVTFVDPPHDYEVGC